jgi:hypothetical protein
MDLMVLSEQQEPPVMLDLKANKDLKALRDLKDLLDLKEFKVQLGQPDPLDPKVRKELLGLRDLLVLALRSPCIRVAHVLLFWALRTTRKPRARVLRSTREALVLRTLKLPISVLVSRSG